MVFVVSTASYPDRIGCDLRPDVISSAAGSNVMTTAEYIMGAPPIDNNDLASASTDQFGAGSNVTITFLNTFGRGFVHATAGTFIAPQFAADAVDGASPCLGSETIKYKNTVGSTNSIIWTAPSDVSAISTVTISIAGASGFGSISRKTITLTNSAGSDKAERQYQRIKSGNCASNKMEIISDAAACGAAVEALGLAVISPGVTATSETPLPEGCFYVGDRLYLSLNSANAGNGASPPYELICLTRASSAKSANGGFFDNSMTIIIIGGSSGIALICFLCVVCMFRKLKPAERFEV
eukprot:CAMPEP_0169090948 /NCGR_PEP_ID=MMETSP1015-20121227/16097_1 /TAXON_ID=342587 /ORGANISM="Karlodinium micrum, Strain CCMP2283" /LENGTH=295 /DNA_ID=CAMNT_0009151399 /DNA_START=71 /DNA_END=958 /DNA_ORIENTATION=-